MTITLNDQVSYIRRLALTAVALLITGVLLTFSLIVASRVTHARFDHHSKPEIQLVAPACKICHCGKKACHRECGEDAMCTMRCEGLCRKTK